MTPEIRRRIHAFRNALVLAADTRSNECFRMGRWQELNAFPHGCCDLASHFLAQYLQDSDPTLTPVIVSLTTTAAFRLEEESAIEAHTFVELHGWFIDLTLNQFAEYQDRVVIDDRTGILGTLRRTILGYDGEEKEQGIQLDTTTEDGSELYAWLKEVADGLLTASGQDRKPGSMPPLVSTEILPQYRAGTVAAPSDKATHVTEQKNRQPMTHVGIITECYRPREVRLRETRTWWVSECGLRFRKSTGATVGSGVWSANRLDLSSIREIQPGA